MSTVYINFSEYGYHDWYPVDTAWMNYQFTIANDYFEEQTDIDFLHNEISMGKLELILESYNGEMDSVWLGNCLFNMALRGLNGEKLPEFFFV